MKKLILSTVLSVLPLSVALANQPAQVANVAKPTAASTQQDAPLAAAVKLYAAGDYKAAHTAFSELSKKGDAQATYNLGVLYEKGQGVAKSDKKAIEHYTKAANGGASVANFALAKAYINGTHGLKKDFQKGKNYLTLASNAGLPAAQLALAHMLLQENKPESVKTSVALLESLSAKKVIEATHLLGLVNLNKEKYPSADPKRAVKLLEESANRGFIPSIALLGDMNYKGQVLEKNLKNAESYYKVLADNKVPNADKVLKEIQTEVAKQKKS